MNSTNNILQTDQLPAMCVMPREALISLVNITAQDTVNKTLRELGVLKDEISQREAHRIFGSGIVQSLLNRGLIHRTAGKGERSKITYFRTEIETALKLQGTNLLTN